MKHNTNQGKSGGMTSSQDFTKVTNAALGVDGGSVRIQIEIKKHNLRSGLV